MMFEEDRATWLKHQFLHWTPFTDQNQPNDHLTKSKSALSICECHPNQYFVHHQHCFLDDIRNYQGTKVI